MEEGGGDMVMLIETATYKTFSLVVNLEVEKDLSIFIFIFSNLNNIPPPRTPASSPPYEKSPPTKEDSIP